MFVSHRCRTTSLLLLWSLTVATECFLIRPAKSRTLNVPFQRSTGYGYNPNKKRHISSTTPRRINTLPLTNELKLLQSLLHASSQSNVNENSKVKETNESRKNHQWHNNKSNYYRKQRHPQSQFRKRRNKRSSSPAEVKARLERAWHVEKQLHQAIQLLKRVYHHKGEIDLHSSTPPPTNIKFPSVRECNAVLAVLGDTGDFKRALHLFGQMRNAAAIVKSYNESHDLAQESSRVFVFPPSPTLVTYSTLMSRAVAFEKEQVALRLWKLMTLQTEFYTNLQDVRNTNSSGNGINILGQPIVPDIRAVNILMNAFAKLGDNKSANELMLQLHIGNKDDRLDTCTTHDKIDGFTNERSNIPPEIYDLIRVVPKMKPNIVTYNTLIDACHRAGDLDAALATFDRMKANSSIRPDARTYTSLISTVARRATRTSGASDPDLAFSLLDDMINTSGMQPNGMTWCALIDVCGRCNRSDLALKGLRMMMRQKANIQSKQINVRADKKYKVLANEVGAWTAAINACGKAGRIDTAIKLFHTMAKFGVKPNTITCGCLTDCLMKSKNENYLSETLTVLRYMKEENMVPSEVMYTSLIDRASILATIENERRGELILPDFGDGIARPIQNSTVSHDDVNESTTALDVYTELILSLTTSKSRGNDESNAPLVKVFLVFQEMKASGADPDLTCYNALLRACARAGAAIRQQDIMRRLQLDGLIPNDKTWKEMLRGGAQAGRSDLVEDIWKQALDYNVEGQGERYSHKKWMPDIDSFDALITSYLRHASTSNIDEKRALYEKCITAYLDVIGKRSNNKKLHHIDSAMLQESTRSMLLVLMASVSLEEILFQSHDMSENRMFDQQKVRRIAKHITRLGCLQGRLPKSLIDLNPVDSFRKARSWTFTD